MNNILGIYLSGLGIVLSVMSIITLVISNYCAAGAQWCANYGMLSLLEEIFGDRAEKAYMRVFMMTKRSKLWRLCYDLKNTQEYKIAHNDFKDIDEIVEHMPEYTREFILSKKPHLTEAYFNEKVKEMSKILRIKPLREVVFSDLLGDKGE